jgi:poly(hydroxyalkanoate) granule-associated protein
MASKKKVEKEAASRVGGIEKSSRQIWLAGLGAYARASTDDGTVFQALVKEGEQVEQQIRAQTGKPVEKVKASARSTVDGLKEKALDKWGELEEAFDKRLDSAISRLGVPSRHEVAALTEKVDVLMSELKRLGGSKVPPAPPALEGPDDHAPKPLTGAAPKPGKPPAAKPVLKKAVGKAAADKADSSVAKPPVAEKKASARKPGAKAGKAVPVASAQAPSEPDSNA